MMQEPIRIMLPDGNWWDIRRNLTRGMEKAVTRATLANMPQLKRNGNTGGDAKAIAEELLQHVQDVNIGAIEDAYLLQGTVGFSYGPIVSQEIIDNLDAAIVRTVITRMFEVYNPQRVTEEQRKDFFEKPLSVISANQAENSQKS